VELNVRKYSRVKYPKNEHLVYMNRQSFYAQIFVKICYTEIGLSRLMKI
jgi:hypothetical protein